MKHSLDFGGAVNVDFVDSAGNAMAYRQCTRVLWRTQVRTRSRMRSDKNARCNFPTFFNVTDAVHSEACIQRRMGNKPNLALITSVGVLLPPRCRIFNRINADTTTYGLTADPSRNWLHLVIQERSETFRKKTDIFVNLVFLTWIAVQLQACSTAHIQKHAVWLSLSKCNSVLQI